jgi:hypothetical protein
MKTCSTIALALVTSCFTCLTTASAQQRTPYEIKKIAPAVIQTPDYQYSGEKRRSEQGKWLEIEVEFDAVSNTPHKATDELTFKYYVLLNGTLFVGEVTHINIIDGANISVMYIAPGTLTRAMQGKALTGSSIENIAVEISKQGALQSTLSFAKNSRPNWWQSMQQIPNLVVNKNQTPFAPLYWDRYPEIKPQAR